MIYNFDKISFQILSVVKVDHKDGFFEVAARPYAALSFRTTGRAVFDIDGKRIVNEPGDIIYIPADMPYRADYLSTQSIVVHLIDCNYGEAEKISTLQSSVIADKFRKMLDSWREDHSVNRAKSRLYDLFARLEKESTDELIDPELFRCLRYIDEHYSDPTIRIERICEEIHVSHSSLQRKFNQYFDMTPKQYIVKLRINKAVDMLSEGDLRIKEVAYACGFEDEKYFSRVFRETFGYPPTRFIENLIM
jgi:AraC-like DNA-binding protein